MTHDELHDYATPVIPTLVENDYDDELYNKEKFNYHEDDVGEVGSDEKVIGMSYNYDNEYYFY